MNEYVDKRPISGMFEDEFIFEKVENRLDERAVMQKDFFFKNIRTFFIVRLMPMVIFNPWASNRKIR